MLQNARIEAEHISNIANLRQYNYNSINTNMANTNSVIFVQLI